jgi:hypothetical protein
MKNLRTEVRGTEWLKIALTFHCIVTPENQEMLDCCELLSVWISMMYSCDSNLVEWN